MTLTIRRIRNDFAAEISGVDITKPILDATFAEIRAALDEYSVLVFRDQKFDDDAQTAFSLRFGSLETTISANAGGGTHIADISNVDPATDEIIPVEGWRSKYNSGNEMWHTDSSFKPVPALASLLSGREVPPEGAETEFTSMRTAYDALPDDHKARLEGLIAIHDFSYSRGLVDPALMDDKQRAAVPPVRQAVVRTNPANGRKGFYSGSHASEIVGWPVDEGRAFLKDLVNRAVKPERVYAHKWQQYDLVIWDNRCVLHRGRPRDKSKHRRVMHRTTVAGDGPTA